MHHYTCNKWDVYLISSRALLFVFLNQTEELYSAASLQLIKPVKGTAALCLLSKQGIVPRSGHVGALPTAHFAEQSKQLREKKEL